MSSETPQPATPSRAPWTIFWAALLVRVLYIAVAHTYRIRLFNDHFEFGWEMGRVGRALATGYGFADPFMGHSGPTAWFPPLYPLLIGAVFKVFGVYTQLSAFVLFTINSIFSAATALAVYQIGLHTFNRRVALWSGWLWALYPAAMQYATHWIWDMAVTTCLFAWVIVLALNLQSSDSQPAKSPRQLPITALWATFGLLWGLIALLNSSLLIFLPFCILWMAWPQRHRLLLTTGRATLAVLLCVACIAPWILRDYRVFHAFIPIRANFGAELYASSLTVNDGFPYGPSVSVFEASPDMQRFKKIGEVAFSTERAQMAKAIFRAHPGRFRAYTLKRIWFYWGSVPHPIAGHLFVELTRELNYSFISLAGLLGLGLALRRRRPGAVLFGAAFVLLPLTYYVVTVQARFRAPIEPLLCILGVYLFQSADRSRPWSWTRDKFEERELI